MPHREEFISPETLRRESKAYFETAKEYEQLYGSKETMVAYYLRLAQLFEEKARDGGYYGVPESTLLVGVGDPVLKAINEQSNLEQIEKSKTFWRSPEQVGHRKNSSLLPWEMRDLQWLLELQARNDLPAYIDVRDSGNPELLHRTPTTRLIEALKEGKTLDVV
jgi:hypothetical protein